MQNECIQLISNCYTVVSYYAMLRHSIYKHSAVYISDSRVTLFCKIRTFEICFLCIFMSTNLLVKMHNLYSNITHDNIIALFFVSKKFYLCAPKLIPKAILYVAISC